MRQGLNIIYSCLFTTILVSLLLSSQIAIASGTFCNGPYQKKKLTSQEVITLSNQTEKPNLCGADLSGLDLTDINLQAINLNNATLINTKLINSNLQQANLYNADLTSANLSNALLIKTNLELAKLNFANLENANLQEARLQATLLQNANLTNTILTLADLDEMHAQHAIFTHAEMSFCTIQKANLNFAQLKHVNLYASNLHATQFVKANLQHAKLINSNLENVDFSMADLSFASIKYANVKNSIFYQTNVFHMDYRPQYNTIPEVVSLATTKNFNTMEFYDQNLKTLPMLELHAAYSNLGLLHMQRLTTAMIEKTELQQAWLQGGGIARIKSFIYYILFEYTCDYGNNPIRPIQLMLYLTLIFAFLYWAMLCCTSENHGIIKIDAKHNNIVLKKDRWHIPLWTLYFSLLNTFNIGCGNCKLAKLITDLQYDDYELIPIGIVRTIAGLQSLITTYLFLLWILVCFGDPFTM